MVFDPVLLSQTILVPRVISIFSRDKIFQNQYRNDPIARLDKCTFLKSKCRSMAVAAKVAKDNQAKEKPLGRFNLLKVEVDSGVGCISGLAVDLRGEAES